jgi:ABC-type transport system substrate-binding protein
MRMNFADLIWPLPANLHDESQGGYQFRSAAAHPARSLRLVMRADTPPTTRREARRALAHGIARNEVVRLLGPGADRRTSWTSEGEAADFPALDPGRVREWMARGKLGRSFRVTMAYRRDGPGAAIARSLQEEWSRVDIYVEPKALPAERFQQEALSGLAQVLIVEQQPLIPSLSGELAQLVMPYRGPAVGAFRTGWRTREFDPDPKTGEVEASAASAERRLEEEMVALPLAGLDWTWAERASGPHFEADPRFGPRPLLPVGAGGSAHP